MSVAYYIIQKLNPKTTEWEDQLECANKSKAVEIVKKNASPEYRKQWNIKEDVRLRVIERKRTGNF